MPVLEFNSGSYDLNLIREHFGEQMVENNGTDIRVAKKANKNMFMATPKFKFLVIINYLGPRTSCEKTKAHGCTSEKFGFPYEWFESKDKLDFPGLPDYPAWYSKLKEKFVLSLQEWKECKKLF